MSEEGRWKLMAAYYSLCERIIVDNLAVKKGLPTTSTAFAVLLLSWRVGFCETKLGIVLKRKKFNM